METLDTPPLADGGDFLIASTILPSTDDGTFFLLFFSFIILGGIVSQVMWNDGLKSVFVQEMCAIYNITQVSLLSVVRFNSIDCAKIYW